VKIGLCSLQFFGGSHGNTYPREYKSPRRKLLRFFEKSRDKWKLKYREVKKVLKWLTNRIRFLERSKAEYKQRVEELQAQLAALKASRLEKGGERGIKKKRSAGIPSKSGGDTRWGAG
jgi:DNA repair ATPase RecN